MNLQCHVVETVRQTDMGLILDHDLGYITETLRMGFPVWKMVTI